MKCSKCGEDMSILNFTMMSFKSGNKPYGIFVCKNKHKTAWIPLNKERQPLDVKIRVGDLDKIREFS